MNISKFIKVNLFAGSIIFLLIGLNLFLLLRLNKGEKNIQFVTGTNNRLYERLFELKIHGQLANNSQLKLLNKQLGNLLLEDVSSVEIKSLDQVLESVNSKIVFYFSPNQCHTCIEQEIPNIKAFADSIGSHNIVLLASDSNRDYLRRFALIKKINMPFYLIKNPAELNKEIHEADAPFAFLVDKKGTIIKACSLTSALNNWSLGFYQSFRKGTSL